MTTFEEFKRRKEAQYKASNIPYTEEDLQRQYDATRELDTGLTSALKQDALKVAARKQAAETLRLNVDNPNMSLSERMNLGSTPETPKPEEPTAQVSPVPEASSRKPLYPTPTGQPIPEVPSPTSASEKTAITTETRSLAKELSKGNEESSKYLAEMRAWAESPENKKTTPPDVQTTLKEALDRAQDLHSQNATRNEWLEVAQKLGDAVTRYGAARAGLASGVDMSKIDTGANVDYGARTDRSFRQFESSAKRAGDVADRTRQSWADTEAARKENYDNKEQFLKQGLHYSSQKEESDLRYKNDAAREARGEKSAQAREDNALRGLTAKDLDSQEKDLNNQLVARQALVNQIEQEDLKGSDKDKLESKYGKLAGDARINLSALNAELAAATKKGDFWGTNPDEEKQKSILAGKVNEIKDLLSGIRAQKKALLSGRQVSSSGVQSSSAPPSPVSGSVVMIQGPSGDVASMTREAAQKYLSKPGYQIVK